MNEKVWEIRDERWLKRKRDKRRAMIEKVREIREERWEWEGKIDEIWEIKDERREERDKRRVLIEERWDKTG
jgi:uncharacterized coiled-coil DUF342 family protein